MQPVTEKRLPYQRPPQNMKQKMTRENQKGPSYQESTAPQYWQTQTTPQETDPEDKEPLQIKPSEQNVHARSRYIVSDILLIPARPQQIPVAQRPVPKMYRLQRKLPKIKYAAKTTSVHSFRDVSTSRHLTSPNPMCEMTELYISVNVNPVRIKYRANSLLSQEI